MVKRIQTDIITAFIRQCFVLKANRRVSWSIEYGARGEDVWSALVLESVKVAEPHRQQGHCRALIDQMCVTPGHALFIVEAVQNPHLAAALNRWDWECDPGVMDFYRFRKEVE